MTWNFVRISTEIYLVAMKWIIYEERVTTSIKYYYTVWFIWAGRNKSRIYFSEMNCLKVNEQLFRRACLFRMNERTNKKNYNPKMFFFSPVRIQFKKGVYFKRAWCTNNYIKLWEIRQPIESYKTYKCRRTHIQSAENDGRSIIMFISLHFSGFHSQNDGARLTNNFKRFLQNIWSIKAQRKNWRTKKIFRLLKRNHKDLIDWRCSRSIFAISIALIFHGLYIRIS